MSPNDMMNQAAFVVLHRSCRHVQPCGYDSGGIKGYLVASGFGYVADQIRAVGADDLVFEHDWGFLHLMQQIACRDTIQVPCGPAGSPPMDVTTT